MSNDRKTSEQRCLCFGIRQPEQPLTAIPRGTLVVEH